MFFLSRNLFSCSTLRFSAGSLGRRIESQTWRKRGISGTQHEGLSSQYNVLCKCSQRWRRGKDRKTWKKSKDNTGNWKKNTDLKTMDDKNDERHEHTKHKQIIPFTPSSSMIKKEGHQERKEYTERQPLLLLLLILGIWTDSAPDSDAAAASHASSLSVFFLQFLMFIPSLKSFVLLFLHRSMKTSLVSDEFWSVLHLFLLLLLIKTEVRLTPSSKSIFGSLFIRNHRGKTSSSAFSSRPHGHYVRSTDERVFSGIPQEVWVRRVERREGSQASHLDLQTRGVENCLWYVFFFC